MADGVSLVVDLVRDGDNKAAIGSLPDWVLPSAARNLRSIARRYCGDDPSAVKDWDGVAAEVEAEHARRRSRRRS